MLTILDDWLKSAIGEVQEYVNLSWAAVRHCFSRPFYFHDVIEQLESIGVGSLTVVLLTGTFTGAVLALQSGLTLDQFGARPIVGRLVSASMVKELGPVLTALMLAGRVGSGIAAELGSMVVTDQINALRALGTDPVRKLVVPRVIAGVFMAPILTVISDLMGILGGAIWCVGMSFSILASGKAGAAISYGLGQGATVIAAIWGIFVWKEFRNASKEVSYMLNLMLLLYVAGIVMIIAAR